jgi:hypothetical protein
VSFDPKLDNKRLSLPAHSRGDHKSSEEEVDKGPEASIGYMKEQEENPGKYELRSKKEKTFPKTLIPKVLDQGPLLLKGIDKTIKDGAKEPIVDLVKEDTYEGTSLLRYSNGEIEENPEIPSFSHTKAVPPTKTSTKTTFQPKQVDVYPHTRSRSKSQKTRTSTKKGRKKEKETRKAKNSTRWESTRDSSILSSLNATSGSTFVPTHITALPPRSKMNTASIMHSSTSYLKLIEKGNKLEKLFGGGK